MTFEPSPQQALAIFSMIFGRDAEQQHPTKKQLGLPVAERTSLERHRFLEFTKVAPRSERASLSDDAWAWAADHLDAALPKKPAIWRVTLSGVLARLRDHLGRTNGALAEFAPEVSVPLVRAAVARKAPRTKVTSARKRKPNVVAGEQRSKSAKPASGRKRAVDMSKADPSAFTVRTRRKEAGASKVAPPKAKPQKAEIRAGTGNKSRKNPAVPNPVRHGPRTAEQASFVRPTLGTARSNANGNGALAARIRSTCIELGAGSTRVRVRLRDLRARLPDVPRAQLDQALQELQLDGALVLYRIDDPTDISREDASAALHIAAQPRHILYLER